VLSKLISAVCFYHVRLYDLFGTVQFQTLNYPLNNELAIR